MKIMFMGTPEIAATALGKLLDFGHNVVAVVTREDKVRGRGNTLTPTPTKLLALEKNIPVYTPGTLKDDDFRELLRAIAPDIIVVVAYGKILPPEVLEYPKYGCINMHVSLLPKYRGAAPMQRAIMDGESKTGVSIMYMAEGLDTGDIISACEFDILENDDFEAIHDKSADIGSALLCKTISDIEQGRASRTPQNEAMASYAMKIEKEDCHADFSLDTATLHARIRGVTPIPGAFVYHNDKMLKIFDVTKSRGKGAPGEVIALDSKGAGCITVATLDGALDIHTVVPQGKGKMTAGDYIRGRKIILGDSFK